jgi:polysaccharide deacetylase family protein (PEP-CTERM system associated)
MLTPASPQLDTSPPPIRHIFTIDVEEHFHVTAFERSVVRSDWDRHPSRVVQNMHVMLDTLASFDTTCTCFVLGWVAERHPSLVREIVGAGHEVASHGYWHRRVTANSRSEFREDVSRSKALLEDITGQPVYGYRAPSFSIIPGLEWAFDVLIEEGYRYDSSLFPIKRRGYGYPGAPPIPHLIERGGDALWEFPMTTLSWRERRIPAAGGAYLRHLPFGIIRQAFDSAERDGVPGMFYIHPWEIDADQPRVKVSPLTHLRHYGGIQRTRQRIHQLLTEFRFTSVARHLEKQGRTRRRDTPRLSGGTKSILVARR